MTIENIIPLPSDRHQEALELLPWYVTGAIEPADRVKVEAHLVDCALCRAELVTERTLSAAIADLPLNAGLGFAEFRRRLDITPPPATPRHSLRQEPIKRLSARPRWIGWAVAAQAAVLLFVGVGFPQRQKPAEYRTLGAAPGHPAGNMVVMFGPDMSERTMRHLLANTGARLVDGPTPAGVYVLAVPSNRRAAALVQLRSRSDVVLVQPIDRDDRS